MTAAIWIEPEIYEDDVRIVRTAPTNFEVWEDDGSEVGTFLGEFATYDEAANLVEVTR